MTRLYCQEVGGCIQRCMGCDGLNALSIASYDADQKHGTSYYKNFIELMKKVQAEDLTLVCAQTDVKGNRPWRPGKQQDPDLYLRVVEKRDDGIIVNGAKAHNTCAAYADEIIVLPTRNMVADERAPSFFRARRAAQTQPWQAGRKPFVRRYRVHVHKEGATWPAVSCIWAPDIFEVISPIILAETYLISDGKSRQAGRPAATAGRRPSGVRS